MKRRHWHLHIDGSEGAVGDGTADSACKGESGVEGNATELLSGSVNLDSGSCRRGHCECVLG